MGPQWRGRLHYAIGIRCAFTFCNGPLMAQFLTRLGGAVSWLPLVAILAATVEAQRAPERDRAAVAASQSSRWWMGPQVRGVVTDVSHPLIGRPLFGASVGLTLARPAGHVAWTVRAEFLNGDAARFGVVCAGFVPPGSCDQREAIADVTRLTTGRVGLAVAVIRHQRVRLSVLGEAGVGRIRTVSRGRTTGLELSGTETLAPFEAGLRLDWRPLARVPLSVEIEGSATRFVSITPGVLLDGYSPFAESFGARSLRLGAVWWLPIPVH